MPYSPVTQPSAPAKMAVRLAKQLDHDPGGVIVGAEHLTPLGCQGFNHEPCRWRDNFGCSFMQKTDRHGQ
jgi:hypothetical protein